MEISNVGAEKQQKMRPTLEISNVETVNTAEKELDVGNIQRRSGKAAKNAPYVGNIQCRGVKLAENKPYVVKKVNVDWQKRLDVSS
ncbi:hypothetical protein [Paenibacillus radicis (ex Gao et al. 2016)]|uniref:Uncharacterized protein n=1 Tax=Paenibacillus radicis (ex Gao et al. 2016) TaxID=1737354 RepID=A0A917LTN6_9BACL|nr:hypothetical protein [Paenibacillus radicis (ex Gao et al. 2016)]GGG56775.1 hypothetical protein GCM10010918_07240 [Paenibacillus radicis (ex Gao et al. 2016)]